MKSTHFLTQEGYDKLMTEKESLEKERRPQAVEALKKAREMGDLSENSGYTSAKEELSFIDSRIAEIDETLAAAQIIKHTADKTVVQIGDTLLVEVNDKQEELRLVGEHEADISAKKLSIKSPIGQALLGKKKGEEIKIEVPAGQAVYKILDIM